LKSYRSTRDLRAEIQRVLAQNRPDFHHSPLDQVIELLIRGRHYSWVGIYLIGGEDSRQQLLGSRGNEHPHQIAAPATRSKILISIKLAGRDLGVLAVESDSENTFGSEDRVLLENVADLLARFLTGSGKYIARKARQAASTTTKPQARAPQSASPPSRSAAVGEK
jgi:putative methionine-R-sulfoxide reductase with GAF domain